MLGSRRLRFYLLLGTGFRLTLFGTLSSGLMLCFFSLLLIFECSDRLIWIREGQSAVNSSMRVWIVPRSCQLLAYIIAWFNQYLNFSCLLALVWRLIVVIGAVEESTLVLNVVWLSGQVVHERWDFLSWWTCVRLNYIANAKLVNAEKQCKTCGY